MQEKRHKRQQCTCKHHRKENSYHHISQKKPPTNHIRYTSKYKQSCNSCGPTIQIDHILIIANIFFLFSFRIVIVSTAMCFLTDNIYDYYNVSQGKTTIPNMDDGEEFALTDVSLFM